MKALTMTAGAVIACMIAGCASKPPTELKNARAAYQDAAQSPGANLATTDVYEAQKSLNRAEAAFDENGDSPETRDLAYVAERRAVIAKASGNTALAMRQKQLALQEAQRWRDQQAMSMRQQLGQTKGELEKTQAQLESERAARIAAEQRTAETLTRISGLTAKQDQRGLVLTLSGSVLFAFGKSELLPAARQRLDEVVVALKEDPRTITIVGHTDSVGSDDKNMALSQRRADAVRNYLAMHGLPESRVNAEGVGETQPVASNKTADGRANNRRVEIILNNPPGGQQPMPGMGGQQGGMQQQMPSGGMQVPSTGPQQTHPSQQQMTPQQMQQMEQQKQQQQQMQQKP